MALLTRINGKRRIITAGDLTVKLDVQLRTLTPAAGAGVDASEAFATLKSVWGMELTNSGQNFFSETNIKRDATHIFYIRFIANSVFDRAGRLSAQEWVKFKGREFKVLLVENLEERDEFLALWCNERGASGMGVNVS
jgi:SPP1 family predicted phage head-tail adaptor